ncbi:MAG: hypothetical protein KAG53_08685 [Endozoicomonadaceae bacterium]|nr:hypothetical protein [Endozoicomonadaceae bacterium]
MEASFDHEIKRLSIISDERKRKNAGEFYFDNDSLSKQIVIDQLSCEHSFFSVFALWKTLNNMVFMQQVWLTDDGQLQQKEAQLFLDNSLILVFDLTNMTPGEIASFNDVLQVEPKCNDKPLGDHVRQVCLFSDAMLTVRNMANPDL